MRPDPPYRLFLLSLVLSHAVALFWPGAGPENFWGSKTTLANERASCSLCHRLRGGWTPILIHILIKKSLLTPLSRHHPCPPHTPRLPSIFTLLILQLNCRTEQCFLKDLHGDGDLMHRYYVHVCLIYTFKEQCGWLISGSN